MAGQSCRSSSLVPTQSGNRPTGEAQETETETVKDKRHEQERTCEVVVLVVGVVVVVERSLLAPSRTGEENLEGKGKKRSTEEEKVRGDFGGVEVNKRGGVARRTRSRFVVRPFYPLWGCEAARGRV